MQRVAFGVAGIGELLKIFLFDEIDKLLGNCGTEAIRGKWQNGYWCDIVAAYSNLGDSYEITVLHIRGDSFDPAGRFIVGTVGDFVERNQEKYSIL